VSIDIRINKYDAFACFVTRAKECRGPLPFEEALPNDQEATKPWMKAYPEVIRATRRQFGPDVPLREADSRRY